MHMHQPKHSKHTHHLLPSTQSKLETRDVCSTLLVEKEWTALAHSVLNIDSAAPPAPPLTSAVESSRPSSPSKSSTEPWCAESGGLFAGNTVIVFIPQTGVPSMTANDGMPASTPILSSIGKRTTCRTGLPILHSGCQRVIFLFKKRI